jgi:D-arabinose 1-dehydrogenase-like Zn-dependent alcohol dehydrogenase
MKQVQAHAKDGMLEAVIDMVGTGSTVQFGLDALARGGTFVAVGLLGGDVTIPTPLLAQRALSIRGSFVGSLSELSELVKLLRSGKATQIPTRTMRLEAANDALDKLKAGAVIGRIVLQP